MTHHTTDATTLEQAREDMRDAMRLVIDTLSTEDFRIALMAARERADEWASLGPDDDDIGWKTYDMLMNNLA